MSWGLSVALVELLVELSAFYALYNWRVVHGLPRRLMPYSHCKPKIAEQIRTEPIRLINVKKWKHSQWSPKRTEPDWAWTSVLTDWCLISQKNLIKHRTAEFFLGKRVFYVSICTRISKNLERLNNIHAKRQVKISSFTIGNSVFLPNMSERSPLWLRCRVVIR